MDNNPQQLSRGDSFLNTALLEYERLQQNEDLHRALANHRAYLEELKVEYCPKLEASIVEIHAQHAYMQAQIELIVEMQRVLTPNQPQPEAE